MSQPLQKPQKKTIFNGYTYICLNIYIYIYPYLTPWFIFRSYWFLTNTHADLWQ